MVNVLAALQVNAGPVLLFFLAFQLTAELVRRYLFPFLWTLGRSTKDIKADEKLEALHRDKWMYDSWMFTLYLTTNLMNMWVWSTPWVWNTEYWGCVSAGIKATAHLYESDYIASVCANATSGADESSNATCVTLLSAANSGEDAAITFMYRYVCALYMHMLVWEVRVWKGIEKKRQIYVFHHILTLLLIFFSWYHGWMRWGAILVLWHDVADPPLALAKMAVHMWGDENLLSDILFGVFVICFAVPRLYWYPKYILSQVYECVRWRVSLPNGILMSEWTIVLILHALWACHWVWICQIIYFAYKKFALGNKKVYETVMVEGEAQKKKEE